VRAPTKEEHDAKVARTGRPYTQDAPKAHKVDQPAVDAGFIIRKPRASRATKVTP
jgi:hypothetical protein